MKDEGIRCICSRCKKKFQYKDAVTKSRKLYNVEIEEKCCPFCGSKGFTNIEDIYFIETLAGYHSFSAK